MSNLKLFVILLVVIILAPGCQSNSSQNSEERELTVILTNPTVGNLTTMQYLTDKKVFDLPDDAQFLCVYHPSQSYKFDQTKQYIEENSLSNFTLRRVDGELNEQNLFDENECTDAFRQIFDKSDGVIFFGGPDIPPSVYGEENTLSVVSDSGRHYFELSFLFHLLGSSKNNNHVPFLESRPDYLVTGFCLGLQTMNVATGGSLYQDIPADIYNVSTPEEKIALGSEKMHRNYWRRISKDTLLMTANFHTIMFTDHPFFGEIISMSKELRPLTYSSHHQSIKDIGKGFVVTALSTDGKIIEGIAHTIYPHVFGVQFHPEIVSLYEKRGVRRIAPTDEPQTYPEMIGEESLEFHRAYWSHISNALKN